MDDKDVKEPKSPSVEGSKPKDYTALLVLIFLLLLYIAIKIGIFL